MINESGSFSMIEHLFVYGTLQPGRENVHLLESIGGRWQKAWVLGHLYPQGFASTEGYPALVLDSSGPEVAGYLFSSTALETHWPALDDFEGDGYRRMVATVRTEAGEATEAWLYEAADPGM